MSSRLTSELRVYADKARDLNRQVSSSRLLADKLSMSNVIVSVRSHLNDPRDFNVVILVSRYTSPSLTCIGFDS